MRLGLICLIIESILLSGIAVVLLSRIGKAVTAVSVGIWGIFGCTAVIFTIVQCVTGTSMQARLYSIWVCLLACGGVVVLRYAKRYEKKMLGLYALLTDGVVAATVYLELFVHKPLDIGGLKLVPYLILLVGYTATAILCSLSLVAGKRPIKVKRWLRVSFLCLGTGFLLASFLAFLSKGSGQDFPWAMDRTLVLVTLLILGTMLHGKKTYTKGMCLLPFAFVVMAMLIYNEARLLFVGILGAGIGAFVVLMKQSLLKVPEVDVRDTIELFRLATYVYAALVFGITVVWVLTGVHSFEGVYNAVTIGYLIALVIFLIMDQPPMTQLKYIAAIVWNTLVAMLLILIGGGLTTFMAVLVWVCLFPITFFFLQGKSVWKDQHRILHLMLSVGILGSVGILCGSMGYLVFLFFLGGAGVLIGTIYRLFFGNL